MLKTSADSSPRKKHVRVMYMRSFVLGEGKEGSVRINEIGYQASIQRAAIELRRHNRPEPQVSKKKKRKRFINTLFQVAACLMTASCTKCIY